MVISESGDSERSGREGDGRLMLFWISLLTLFIEIMLIRHLASEIRIFAHFKNLALIGAFLGLGYGYLYRPRVSPSMTAVCMALLVLATHPFSGFAEISTYLSFESYNSWVGSNRNIATMAMGLLMLLVLFFLVIISMIPMGQILARIFDSSKNRILDYSINIAGSMAGVWLFSLVSFMQWEPVTWYMFSIAGLVIIIRRNIRSAAVVIVAGVIIAAALLGQGTPGVEVRWSPYQKITVGKVEGLYNINGIEGSIHYHFLNANSVIYMYLLDLSDKYKRSHPLVFDETQYKYMYYDFPYNFPRKLDEVLVLGSGGGNDVAAALRAGAKHVTAVEIDPVIIEYGRKLHPEKPYQSEKVTIVNNDGRNYLRNTDKKFDLIILGLLDSHTLTSNFSNTNLDSFMYTRQSVGDMKAHLSEGGVLALSFQVAKAWIGAKIYQMIHEQFGIEPVVAYFPSRSDTIILGTGGTFFMATEDTSLFQEKMRADENLARIVAQTSPRKKIFEEMEIKQQTDDWPFLYVQKAAIPQIHLLVSAVLLVIFLALALTAFGAPGKSDIHFMGLGAGFLLMEVAVISRFGLFWGTTWIISSIVISLILMAILVANSIYLLRGKGLAFPIIYAIIFSSLVAVYLVPLTSGWVILLYMVPFVAIGLLFAQSFDNAATPSTALAYNLFGSLVGGLSESFSFIFGISALILVGMIFYGFSAAFAGAVHRK
ncbi:MAG: methyltransferase domain-containing protein [Nitrospinota bacterium]|nr:methyltransferase domain-containing protein [Nitrospinota bacterium]